ncbi:MAG: DUF1329 domain-containing protein [Pseudomonadales bacterium]|nr:DUF1329 domain-containing protein [Pseudomonadales bacterium]
MFELNRRFAPAVLFAVGVAFGLQAQAKVSPEEAARIGTELTPMGANPAGNEIGTIPPYSGEILGVPDWVEYKGSGTFYPDPYPGEEALFEINAGNYQDFTDNLTDGQIALFKAYPSFKMPVYLTKRDTRYSDWIHEQVRINAVNAELVEGGNGVRNAFGAVPFPVPANGQELIWNHVYSPNPVFSSGQSLGATVYENGSISTLKRFEERYFQIFDSNIARADYDDIAAFAMSTVTEPARDKGKIVLIHEYSDLTTTPRNAWQYVPGSRRVRRAPTIAYDFPDGPGGLRTVDDALLYNGATDLYTWKMEPMRELFVPYNNNALDDPSVSYETLLTRYHINPEYMRYELRRCRVVVAELKEGKRHLYHKRRFYLDEDSWGGVLADAYDGNGRLWRTNMRTYVNLYDMPGMGPRVEMYHDLQMRAYLVYGLVNEESGPPRLDAEWSSAFFTPANLRKLGSR